MPRFWHAGFKCCGKLFLHWAAKLSIYNSNSPVFERVGAEKHPLFFIAFDHAVRARLELRSLISKNTGNT